MAQAQTQTLTLTGRAIVSRDSLANKGWKMEKVTNRPIKDDELLVEMVASGICHTDIMFGSESATSATATYPRVLGHEGSGYVRAVGPNVTVAKPGDAVLLSFNHCKSCATCTSQKPSLCYEWNERNFAAPPVFSSEDSADMVGGSFFGQSSFAEYSIVSQASVVNATDLIQSKEELELFAPLGCGIQTGCGSVVNVAKAKPKDVIAIQGLGGVGLSAIMAAKIQGCRTIIALDRVESRLQLAKEFGATHTVHTGEIPAGKTITEVVQAIADGVGPNITLETTGVPFLIKSALEMTRQGGTFIQVGSAPAEFQFELPLFKFMVEGKTIRGAIEGNSTPSEFIPKMVKWYRDGNFPFDRLVKKMPAAEFEQGLLEMKTGETIKPVLLWSQ